jgi:hypothetical protein
MTRFLTLIIVLLLAVGIMFAQEPVPQPAPDQPPVTLDVAKGASLNDVFSAVTNISNIAPAAFILSSVAKNTTDWQFTGPLTGRQYNISAARATTLTGAILGGALVVRYLWPKARKFIDVGLLCGAGAFAGKAYANSQGH